MSEEKKEKTYTETQLKKKLADQKQAIIYELKQISATSITPGVAIETVKKA